MRHYLSYSAEGEITGIHAHQQATTGLRGWPEHFEIDNPDTEQPDSRTWLDNLKTKPTGGFIRYECPCSPAQQDCNCANERRLSHYIEGGEFVARTTAIVQIDGEAVEPDATVSRPPGSVLKLKVLCDDPDETVTILQTVAPQLLESTDPTIALPVVDGATAEVNVYSPAQGFTGSLYITSRCFRPVKLNIRGWGS
jgi:hypothetical protein